jgi:hypothetical protein
MQKIVRRSRSRIQAGDSARSHAQWQGMQEIASQLARFEMREPVLRQRWPAAESPHPDDSQAAGPLVAESTPMLNVVGRAMPTGALSC